MGGSGGKGIIVRLEGKPKIKAGQEFHLVSSARFEG